MKSFFGLVIALMLAGCSAKGWSGIDCPDFKEPSSLDFADLLGRIRLTNHDRSKSHRVLHPVKEQKIISLKKEMKNMELLQPCIQFHKEGVRFCNLANTVLGCRPTGFEHLKTKRAFLVNKVVRNIRKQAVVRSEGMSSGAVAQEKRQIPFATVLGILSLGFSLLGWSLLSGGGYGIFLGILGVVGGCLSILIGLFGLNKEWKRAARWAILLGLLAILLNPITFLIAFYGA